MFRSLPQMPRAARLTASLVLTLILSGAAYAHDYKLGTLSIDHPWSRATPGGAKTGGGYLKIENKGTAPDRLVSVIAPVAGLVEIHEMKMNNGVMQMRPLEAGILIPAGGSIVLAPGSYHLMLMDLKQPLKQGEQFKATLIFEKAGRIDVMFNVEALGSSGSAHH